MPSGATRLHRQVVTHAAPSRMHAPAGVGRAPSLGWHLVTASGRLHRRRPNGQSILFIVVPAVAVVIELGVSPVA